MLRKGSKFKVTFSVWSKNGRYETIFTILLCLYGYFLKTYIGGGKWINSFPNHCFHGDEVKSCVKWSEYCMVVYVKNGIANDQSHFCLLILKNIWMTSVFSKCFSSYKYNFSVDFQYDAQASLWQNITEWRWGLWIFCVAHLIFNHGSVFLIIRY